jgi:pyruvate/2-oxoglutarate dehydrogenase complex dihydrolipoamide acyltransferase (E2) component
MSTEVRLPQWGMSMVEGTFVEWFKAEGDAVALGEPLAEVETDKATANLEAPVAGTLKQILVPTGTTVKIQAVVAIIDETSP